MADIDETEVLDRDDVPSANGGNGLIRDAKGRFLPGNCGGPGNPNARSVATWRQALASSVSAADVAEVTAKLLEAAKAGEPWAIRELLDRCLGKPHVEIGVQAQAEMEQVRQYSEDEAREARRIAALLAARDDDVSGGIEPAAQTDPP